ncbi:MAG TPA: FtsX-like permease family protein, partial [Vicinamibacterales bacterium]|nr:FtsX-like permease family protein [Vicinamibacterales bacterium]
RSITLDGRPYNIVGVMPSSFVFPDRDTRLWTPYYVPPVLDPRNPDSRAMSLFGALGRLKAGATPEQAAAEGTARARTAPDQGMAAVATFGTNQPAEIRVTPWLTLMTADVRPALIVMMAAVGLLFLIGIANVASLQLARVSARRREVALRAALGADTRRLARQLLVENLVLGAAGGGVGLVLTWLAHRVLPTLLPATFPRAADIAISWPIAVFAVGASMLAAILVGVLPMLQTRRVGLVQVLNEDSLAPVGGRVRHGVARTRAMIMAGQVAVAAILLVGAGLLGRSFLALISVDRGYDPRNVLTASLSLPTHAFPDARRTEVVDQVLARIRQSPGVQTASAASAIPLSNTYSMSGFRLTPPGGEPINVQAGSYVVSPDYFDALGLRIVQGRALAGIDTATSERAAIVNRAFIRAYLPGQVLGVELPLGDDNENEELARPWKIVGVIDDVVMRSVTDPPRPEVYVSYRQRKRGFGGGPALVVRTSGDPAAFAPILRSIVRDVDRNAVVEGVSTMDQRVLDSLAQPRLYSAVLATFAIFAVVITGVGLFGVLSYMVSLRHREIGVRAALGARPAQIVKLVVAQGALMAVAGVVVGLTAAWMLGKYLTTFLYGVTSRDPITFATVAAALILVSIAACAGPAIRAARIDPLRALRR